MSLLENKDVEIMEHLMFKTGDDIAATLARSLERVEERIDSSESRIHARIAELEDRIESSRQDITDTVGEVREEVREYLRFRDM